MPCWPIVVLLLGGCGTQPAKPENEGLKLPEKVDGIGADYSNGYKKARDKEVNAAVLGGAKDQYDLGMNYYLADDYENAFMWLKVSAGAGYSKAQYRLAYMLQHGIGCGKDIREAKKWYMAAGNGGSTQALHELGVIAVSEKRYPEAIAWYRTAAVKGDVKSQIDLAVLYINGEGVKKNYDRAYAWLKKAADQGDERAKNLIGYLSFQGYVVSNTADSHAKSGK